MFPKKCLFIQYTYNQCTYIVLFSKRTGDLSLKVGGRILVCSFLYTSILESGLRILDADVKIREDLATN